MYAVAFVVVIFYCFTTSWSFIMLRVIKMSILTSNKIYPTSWKHSLFLLRVIYGKRTLSFKLAKTAAAAGWLHAFTQMQSETTKRTHLKRTTSSISRLICKYNREAFTLWDQTKANREEMSFELSRSHTHSHTVWKTCIESSAVECRKSVIPMMMRYCSQANDVVYKKTT